MAVFVCSSSTYIVHAQLYFFPLTGVLSGLMTLVNSISEVYISVTSDHCVHVPAARLCYVCERVCKNIPLIMKEILKFTVRA